MNFIAWPEGPRTFRAASLLTRQQIGESRRIPSDNLGSRETRPSVSACAILLTVGPRVENAAPRGCHVSPSVTRRGSRLAENAAGNNGAGSLTSRISGTFRLPSDVHYDPVCPRDVKEAATSTFAGPCSLRDVSSFVQFGFVSNPRSRSPRIHCRSPKIEW